MDTQVENAIQIAASPSADHNLKTQASTFLTQLRQDPSAWHVCLSLFTRTPPAEDVVRHVSLDILNNVLRGAQLDAGSLATIRTSLMDYIRQRYSPGASQETVDAASIQNKLTQTMTYLFGMLYPSEWHSFFDDFRELANDHSMVGTMFYLRMLGSIHDEIADNLLFRSAEEQKLGTELKDLIRARDAAKIAASWQEILVKWRQSAPSVVEMCLKNVSRWVSWIDISLVVNDMMISMLLELAGQQTSISDSGTTGTRDAAINTFTEIVGKKMKAPDKVELIRSLGLSEIVGRLIASSPLSELRFTSSYDTDLAETVAKLVNAVVVDIVIVLTNESDNPELKERTDALLQDFLPHLLRFFTDQYDEVSCTVIPSLSDLLTFIRKTAKAKGGLPQLYASMLSPILEAVVFKMKYDETSSWGEADDQTDEAEFQDLRKRLYVLQQTLAATDETLYLNTLAGIAANTFASYKANPTTMDWRDLELALHEMYLFGELALKNGGLYQKSQPSNAASETLVGIMSEMLSCVPHVALHPHAAIQIHFMELCVRYSTFFEQHPTYTPQVLDAFVILAHSEHHKVRLQAWHLFLRFIKQVRLQLAPYSAQIIQAILDLLVIRAERSSMAADDDSDISEPRDVVFNSQVFLFEAAGLIASAQHVPVSSTVASLASVTNLLKAEYNGNIAAAQRREPQAVLQIHHIVIAWATLAKGCSEWTPGSSGSPPPAEVAEHFTDATTCTLEALESPQLNEEEEIRNAARFAFSRFFGVLGTRLLPQLPRWINAFLSKNSTKDEVSSLLRLLEQVIYGFKADIYAILDSLLEPLVQRILTALAIPVQGTDDEILVAELRREYLNFLGVILGNGLAPVLISATNMPFFETIISSIESFARDASDLPTARLAFGVLTRMTSTWGGPDIPSPLTNPTPPNPSLQDWDSWAITRFTPLSWSLLMSPKFNAKEAQGRQVLAEIAGMQAEILKKTGQRYLESLKQQLESLGVEGQKVEEYLRAMTEKDGKGFKNFFIRLFVGNS